jgi:hypothetical protein
VIVTIDRLAKARFKDARRLGRFLGVRARSKNELADRVYAQIQAQRLLAAPVLSLPAAPYGREADR